MRPIFDALLRFWIGKTPMLFLFLETFASSTYRFSKRMITLTEEYEEYVIGAESILSFNVVNLEPLFFSGIVSYTSDSCFRRYYMSILSIFCLSLSTALASTYAYITNTTLKHIVILTAHYMITIVESSFGVVMSVALEQIEIKSLPYEREKLRIFVVLLMITTDLGKSLADSFITTFSYRATSLLCTFCSVLLLICAIAMLLLKHKILSNQCYFRMVDNTVKCVCLALKNCFVDKQNHEFNEMGWVGYASPVCNDYVIVETRRFLLMSAIIPLVTAFTIASFFIIDQTEWQRGEIELLFEKSSTRFQRWILSPYPYYIYMEFIIFPFFRRFTTVKSHLSQVGLAIALLLISVILTCIVQREVLSTAIYFPHPQHGHIVVYNTVRENLLVTLDNVTTLTLPSQGRGQILKIPGFKFSTFQLYTIYANQTFSIEIPFKRNRIISYVFYKNGFHRIGYEPMHRSNDIKPTKNEAFFYINTFLILNSSIKAYNIKYNETYTTVLRKTGGLPTIERLKAATYDFRLVGVAYDMVNPHGIPHDVLLIKGIQLKEDYLYCLHLFTDEHNDIQGKLFFIYNSGKLEIAHIYPQILFLLLSITAVDISMFTLLSLESPIDLKSTCFNFYYLVRGPFLNDVYQANGSSLIGERSLVYLLTLVFGLIYIMFAVHIIKRFFEFRHPEHA